MLRDSYLQWMKEFRPEYLEDLLKENRLDAHLDEKMAQVKHYGEILEKRGINAWQIQELVTDSLMPSDQPEPEKKFSPEGKRLLKLWKAGTTA